CNWCIRKYGGLETAQLMPKCCTVNRARLCYNHLSGCEAFCEANTEEEVQKILNLPSVDLHADSIISAASSRLSTDSQQFAISNFMHRLLLVNDQSRFEQLLLRIIVSNALSFTFVKNENTIAVFEFFLLFKFNDHRSNVIQTNSIPSELANNQTSLHNAPILSDEEANKQELVFTDLDYQIELGDRENQFENKDNEILLSSEWNTDFSLEG
ncbi:17268_t:CDS:2, partial [Dentiscutata heterogama]